MKTLKLSPEEIDTISWAIINAAVEELRNHTGMFDKDISCTTNLPEPLNEIFFYCYGDIQREPSKFQLITLPPMDDVVCTLYIDPVTVWTSEDEQQLLPLDIKKIQEEIIYKLEKQ